MTKMLILFWITENTVKELDTEKVIEILKSIDDSIEMEGRQELVKAIEEIKKS